jgi:hypothetical protein
MSEYAEAVAESFKRRRCRCFWQRPNVLRLERDYGQHTFILDIGAVDLRPGESALDYFVRRIRYDHIDQINYAFEEFFGVLWAEIHAAAVDGIIPFED